MASTFVICRRTRALPHLRSPLQLFYNADLRLELLDPILKDDRGGPELPGVVRAMGFLVPQTCIAGGFCTIATKSGDIEKRVNFRS